MLDVNSSIDQLPDATNSQILSGISKNENESTIVKSQILKNSWLDLLSNQEMDPEAKVGDFTELLNQFDQSMYEYGSEDIDEPFKIEFEESLNSKVRCIICLIFDCIRVARYWPDGCIVKEVRTSSRGEINSKESKNFK